MAERLQNTMEAVIAGVLGPLARLRQLTEDALRDLNLQPSDSKSNDPPTWPRVPCQARAPCQGNPVKGVWTAGTGIGPFGYRSEGQKVSFSHNDRFLRPSQAQVVGPTAGLEPNFDPHAANSPEQRFSIAGPWQAPGQIHFLQ